MAAPRKHLSRAPIEEALIDFRVRAPEGLSSTGLLPLAEQVVDRYPIKEELRSFTTTLQLQQGVTTPPQTAERATGWVLRSPDRLCVVQASIQGFTFSRLRPYTRWDEVWAETLRLWQVYVAVAQPLEVTRLATRYINRLQLPIGAGPEVYLSAPPVIPAPAPSAIQGFLSRVQTFDPGQRASAIITQAMEPGVASVGASLLLDIDAFQLVTLAPGDPQKIELVVGGLRALKNIIFFASITEAAAENYQ